MIFIAHRGNTNGIDKDNENNPKYILKAISNGFHAEIDVWLNRDILYLGHDYPQYEITISFIEDNADKLFCHCKNIQAFELLLDRGINCFFHDKDDYTLTSKGIIWAYPGKQLVKNSIAVMPEWDNIIPYNCYGVCTDYPILHSIYNNFNNIYDEIRDRNIKNINESGISYDKLLLDKYDNRYCVSFTGIVKTLYTNNIFSLLLRELSPLLINDISYVYNTPSIQNQHFQANLHHTLMQIINFNNYDKYEKYFTDNLERYQNVFSDFINIFKNMKIILYGVIMTEHAIILKGYPDKDINVYRDMIRDKLIDENLILKEPYKSNTCHITLFRFTGEKNREEIQSLQNICKKFNHIYLGSVLIDKYRLGSHTWRVVDNIIYE